jgi:hypothetical protein
VSFLEFRGRGGAIVNWMTAIFDRLNLRQLKLLLWFLDGHGETNYVESNGIKFEWCDGWMVMRSGPEFTPSSTKERYIMSDAFRDELRSQIGRLAQEETRS